MNRIRVDLGMLDRFRAITCPALKSLLPGLAHHRCSYGEAGGDETPRLGGTEPVPGLGPIPPASSTSISPSAVVGRLFATVAHRPDCLGIGIDEDTPLRVEGCIARASGSGGLKIADASRASHSNAADANPATYFRSTVRLCTHRGAATASTWPRAAPQHGLCRRLSVPRCAPRKDNANRVRRPALNIAGPPTHRHDARASGSRFRRGQRLVR